MVEAVKEAAAATGEAAKAVAGAATEAAGMRPRMPPAHREGCCRRYQGSGREEVKGYNSPSQHGKHLGAVSASNSLFLQHGHPSSRSSMACAGRHLRDGGTRLHDGPRHHGVINFAHGEVVMIGTLVAITVVLFSSRRACLSLLAGACGIVAAAVACMALGWTLERVAYRPLRNAPRLTPLITAIGCRSCCRTWR